MAAATPGDAELDALDRKPNQTPASDTLEGGIWAEVAKAEHAAKTSGERNADPALNSYVRGVLSRVAGPYDGDVRLYVMDRPFFNASMTPTGYTEVWTGLMLRCETEDELAGVLGHETAHFRHSHGLKQFEATRTGQNVALAATLVIATVSVGATANANSYSAMRSINDITRGLIDLTYLGTVSALMSYSRERESEADAYGLSYARKAGYFTGSAADLWYEIQDETAASDYERVRRMGGRATIFDSHPVEADRIAAAKARDAELNGGKPSVRTAEEQKAARLAYRDHIRTYLGAWLKDDLRRQDYGQTLYLVNRLSVDGQDMGLLNFYKGEAFRLRNGRRAGGLPTDMDNAVLAYKAALTFPDAPVETWRQLGDVHRHQFDFLGAIDAFKHYLALAPNAEDAWMVQDQVDTLSKDLMLPAATAEPKSGAELKSGGTK
ncbi:M48 family metalloprotease [Asticcacaulis sp. 201]|uniref:M48 family metalloprotease n=1 Tax=Asticcacaulis sp. 201 TaxID=3028787 RepID=UPI0029164FA6|nr:M48 family metalloprotease [Asticcacaulis sp. 201]MDV6329842.1 M48 family metalloprotease [Asticcacaulis sp. 201]